MKGVCDNALNFYKEAENTYTYSKAYLPKWQNFK